jgi:hypothetical protein
VIQPTCGPLAPRATLLGDEPFFLEENRKSYWGNLVLYSSPQSFNYSDDLIITSKGHYQELVIVTKDADFLTTSSFPAHHPGLSTSSSGTCGREIFTRSWQKSGRKLSR